MKISKAYTFDDLMLVPRHSTIKSRKEPDTKTFLSRNTLLTVPIVSAPMNTVTEREMAKAMIGIGAQAVIHRYMTIEEQVEEFLDSGKGFSPFVAIGATGDFLDRSKALHENGASRFCVDIANGHSDICLQAVEALRNTFRQPFDIMAGNVCSAEGASRLEAAGANIIRVGIGPGAMCTTRQVTGFGVPQLIAIEECSNAVSEASIVADGGIRKSGDIVKALAMGADAVMVGGMLAGTDETPGETEKDSEGRLYKFYHGMASVEGRDGWFEKSATSYVPEGSSTKVWHKGEAVKIVQELNNSVKVGMSFANARNLEELRANAKWVEVSENGRIEGTPNRKMFK